MKTNKQLSLAFISALLPGTSSRLAPRWRHTMSDRIQEGARVGTESHPGTPNPDRIKQIQQALKDRGVYSGPVDGVMRGETRDAIRSFQEANNLHVTTEESMDDETRRALGI